VNFVARLEGLIKDYGVPLIISREFADLSEIEINEILLHEVDLRGITV
jgi:hypothetical protein